MNIGLDGGLGSGKTAKMTGYLKGDNDNGFDVIANYGLNFPSKYLDVKKLLEKGIDLHNVSIGIDEITVLADCRTSASVMNRFLSYLILQSRKRDVNVYYTTQDFSMVELRIIKHTHIQIECESLYYSNGVEIPDWKLYKLYDFRNPKQVVTNTWLEDISKYYGLFDTNEIIEPLI